MPAKKKYDFASLQKKGDFFDVKCKKDEASDLVINIRCAWQMYKKRNNITASYRISRVIGVVIFTRTI